MGLHCEIDPIGDHRSPRGKREGQGRAFGQHGSGRPLGQGLPPAARAAMELLTTPCRNQNLNDEAGLGESWNAWPLAGGHALIFGLPYFAGTAQ